MSRGVFRTFAGSQAGGRSAARARLATLDPARFDAFLVRLTGAGEIDPLARATAHGILLRRGHWDTLALGLRDASPPVRAATAAAAIEMNRDKVEPEMLTHAASDPADLVTEQIVGALRKGLNELEPEVEDVDVVSRADAPVAKAKPADADDTLNSKMSQLLNRALDQNTAGSQSELYHHLLDQLVADEARIVGALSDGSVSPLVNVFDRTRKAVLENAALVGRTANVALPQMTPQYVGHLLALRLVEIGPEDSALKTEYEVLMAETIVLNAIKAASKGPLPAKVEKLTLTLSPLGRSLWAAATAQDDQDGWR